MGSPLSSAAEEIQILSPVTEQRTSTKSKDNSNGSRAMTRE